MFNNFSDLVLLVGTNPLPNYVVIKYFLKHNEKMERVWFVYSEKTNSQVGTEKYADNIKEVIENEITNNTLDFKKVLLRNVGSADAIKQDLKKNFKERALKRSIFHLNYTGGTKSMSVQTYNFFKKKYDSSSFSYLDSRDFKLEGDESKDFVTKDLRHEIGLSLISLINLHGYCENKKSKKPIFSEAIKKFEEIVMKDQLGKYLNWKKEHIRSYYYKNGNIIEKINHFLQQNNLSDAESIIDFKSNFNEKTPDFVFELLKTIPIENSILDDQKENIWIPNNPLSNGNKKFKDRTKFTISFLDGKWLEGYVYDVIKRKIKDNDGGLKKLYEENQVVVEGNLEIIRKNTDRCKPFEVDIFILNGYQVCGISCTTSSKELMCKNKGFEVLHRVRQIGGEEAKTILITCLEDEKIEDFYKDIEDKTRSNSNEFLVLGIEDLKANNLWEKIREHIWREPL